MANCLLASAFEGSEEGEKKEVEDVWSSCWLILRAECRLKSRSFKLGIGGNEAGGVVWHLKQQKPYDDDVVS